MAISINTDLYEGALAGNRQGTWTFEFSGPSGRSRASHMGRWSSARQFAINRARTVNAETVTLVEGPDGGMGVVDGGPVDVLNDTSQTAAVMFSIPKTIASKLAVQAGNVNEGYNPISPEDMHLTVVYLGKTDQQSVDKESVVRALQDFATRIGPISGTIAGQGYFDISMGRAYHALFDSADLPEFRNSLIKTLMDAGVAVDRVHGFIPHITLMYAPGGEQDTFFPSSVMTDEVVTLDTLVLYWGDNERAIVSLKSMDVLVPEDVQIPEEDEDPDIRFVQRKVPAMSTYKSDTVVAWGGPIKAFPVKNGVGVVGGQLVLYGAPDVKDLTGDWFSKATYYGPRDGNGCDTMIHHGIPLAHGLEEYADILLSPLKAVRNKLGVWAEVALKLSNDFERKIYELAQKGVWKWSSGTADHMIKKDETGQILRWPIIEGSLTPTPAEPRMLNHRLAPLKSFWDTDWLLQEDDEAALIVDEQLKAIREPTDDEVQRLKARSALALRSYGHLRRRA